MSTPWSKFSKISVSYWLALDEATISLMSKEKTTLCSAMKSANAPSMKVRRTMAKMRFSMSISYSTGYIDTSMPTAIESHSSLKIRLENGM